MNKGWITLMIVASVASGAAGMFWARGHAVAVGETEPVVVTGPGQVRISSEALGNLKISPTVLSDFPHVLSVTGKISPTEDRTNVIAARANGRLERILIASGEFARAGQPVALIWSPDYLAAREEYVQSLKPARGLAEDFKSLARLARRRLETMGLNEADLNELAAAVAKGQEDSVQKLLVVRAPRAGAIIAKNAVLGGVVNLGDALFTIADLSEVWFLGDLYPEDLTRVKKGQTVVIEGTSNERTMRGQVSFISPIVDPNSRTIKIRALMQNPGLALRDDMYVQGNLVLQDRQAIVLPNRALVHESDGDYVFRVDPGAAQKDVLARKVKVTVLGEQKNTVAVTAGLEVGESIVTDGALLLNAALLNDGK